MPSVLRLSGEYLDSGVDCAGLEPWEDVPWSPVVLASTRALLNGLAPYVAPLCQLDVKHAGLLFAADSIVWTLGLKLHVLSDEKATAVERISERLQSMVQLREFVLDGRNVSATATLAGAVV